jgi:hypothetical protein
MSRLMCALCRETRHFPTLHGASDGLVAAHRTGSAMVFPNQFGPQETERLPARTSTGRSRITILSPKSVRKFFHLMPQSIRDSQSLTSPSRTGILSERLRLNSIGTGCPDDIRGVGLYSVANYCYEQLAPR